MRDSGKVLILANTLTMGSLRDALRAGRVFAIRDLGKVKGQYPVVDSVWADSTGLNVGSVGIINWVVNGRTIKVGSRLEFATLPAGARYARAEIYGLDGSAVYTQAIAVALVGDLNGDRRVDMRDRDSDTPPAEGSRVARFRP